MSMASITTMMNNEHPTKKRRIVMKSILGCICAVIMGSFWLNAFDRAMKA